MSRKCNKPFDQIVKKEIILVKCNKSRWRCTSVIDAERHLMLALYAVKEGLLMCYNGCQRSFNVAERDCTATTDRQGQAGADEADVWLCWLSWRGSSPANEPCARQRDRAVQRHNMTATGRDSLPDNKQKAQHKHCHLSSTATHDLVENYRGRAGSAKANRPICPIKIGIDDIVLLQEDNFLFRFRLFPNL